MSGAMIFAGCGGAGTNTASNTAKSNTAANTSTTSNSDAPKTDAPPAGDSVGVAECDEYIKKYEACLTKITAKAPQAAAPLKTAFEQLRDGWKKAAATPQGKAGLAAGCKQALESAKASTGPYSCEW